MRRRNGGGPRRMVVGRGGRGCRGIRAGLRSGDRVLPDEAVHGIQIAGHHGRAALVAAGLPGPRHPRGAAGDPAAAGDVTHEHRIERGGGLAVLEQMARDGAQGAAQPGDRHPQVGFRIEHVVAGPGRPGGPRRATCGHPCELVELQQPGDAVADRGRIPAGLGLDLRDDPQRRQLGALLRGEVGDQRQVAARGGGEAGGVHARRRCGDVAAGHRAERHTQHGDERTAQDLRNAHARLTRPARSAGPVHCAGGPAGRPAPLSAAAAQPSLPGPGRAARPSRRSPEERPARHGPADERSLAPNRCSAHGAARNRQGGCAGRRDPRGGRPVRPNPCAGAAVGPAPRRGGPKPSPPRPAPAAPRRASQGPG